MRSALMTGFSYTVILRTLSLIPRAACTKEGGKLALCWKQTIYFDKTIIKLFPLPQAKRSSGVYIPLGMSNVNCLCNICFVYRHTNRKKMETTDSCSKQSLVLCQVNQTAQPHPNVASVLASSSLRIHSSLCLCLRFSPYTSFFSAQHAY